MNGWHGWWPFILFYIVEVDLLLIALVIADKLFKFVDFVTVLCILFLLHDQLSNQKLPIIFLGLVFLFQFCIFLDQKSVFVVDSLCYRGDELQVVLHLILFFLGVSSLVALE